MSAVSMPTYASADPIHRHWNRQLRRSELGFTLYRHIKQLHAQDLIEVAETRIVSGITEHRYRAGQVSLDIDQALFGPGKPDETATVIAAVVDSYRNDFIAGIRAGVVRFDPDYPAGQSYRKAVSSMSVATVSPARAAEFRDRLAALVDEIATAEQEPDGVPIRFLAAFYSPVDDSAQD